MISRTQRRITRTLVASASVVALGAAVGLAAPAYAANPVVSIDLSYSLGSVVHGSAGALYGLSQNGTPPASDLSGLNFQTIAQMAPGGTQHPDGDALKVGPEFYGAGGKNVLIYLQDYYPSWPYAKVSMSDYSSLVKSEVAKVQAAPNASKYIYVPFNEPDWIWYGNSGSKLTSFENDWKTIFQAIRSADSSAQIAGPNFENYNDAAYKSFLSFAKANNVLPNLITWHELTLSTLESSWYTHYNDFVADEKSVGVSQIPIDIDEYGQSTDMGVPGKMIEYLARFDADRVEGDMSSWYAGEYLGRLLNTNEQKTSGWYLYYWYGQQNGNSARVTPPDGNGALQAVASIASDKKSARAIIGGSSGNNNITFSGLSSTSLGSSPTVTISSLVNSGDSQSNGPTVTSTYTGSVSNGNLTVTVPNMSANNAYLVQLGAGSGSGGSSSTSTLVGSQSGKCLDVPGGSKTAGTDIDLWTCNGGANQNWTLTNGQLVTAGGLCLDGYGAGTSNGTLVDEWTCSGSANQQWTINSSGQVVETQSGLCLDVYQGSTADGAEIDLWTCSGSANQKWTRG